jgi:sodium/hydrogen antiporter
MIESNAEALVSILALVGIVIIIAALLSGLIERSGFPQVAVFLGLGAALGPVGLNLLNVSLETPILRVVATLSLVLVLFTDAISLNISEVRRYSTLTLLVLGPGTLLSAALVALAGWGLLGLAPAAAILLGAALASTDPVLLRSLLRREDVSNTVRQVLRLESGLNDVVLLPIVLVAMQFLQPGASQDAQSWARLVLDLFLLGPAAGVLVGLFAVATLDLVRRKVGIRRDYESLYSLAVAFTAYGAAEALHGSGFLAAFAAGLTISALDVELCDCFLEYGETTSELTLLFTFVLFGCSLIWMGFSIISWQLILFALAALLVRPVAFLVSLVKVRLGIRDRILMAWFGPRGLSSLLLVLLAVFASIPGSTLLFNICALVVIFSVVVHGTSPMILVQRERKRHAAQTLSNVDNEDQPPISSVSPTQEAVPATDTQNEKQAETSGALETPEEQLPEPVSKVEAQNGQRSDEKPVAKQNNIPVIEPVQQELQRLSPLRISLNEMLRLQQAKAPIVILDARTIRTYEDAETRAKGAIRFLPDMVARRAQELNLPRDAWLIAYCA